ncbi:MAG TPA: SNF2-related protein [Gemmatimonadaceae bacterium]
MDVRLIPSETGEVRHLLASRFLAGPTLRAELGDITLVPHQVDAASRLVAMIERHGGALLADATGMGKTYVAIAVARAFGETVVIAPAALRAMWHDALRRAHAVARFASYEALSRGTVGDLTAPSLLILDEAHHARNPAARRYEVIAALAWGARVLLLSATPIHNRPNDLRALIALFAGSRAWSMSADELSGYIVRRNNPGRGRPANSLAVFAPALPSLDRPVWLDVDTDPDTLHAIEALPPAVPAADGGAAHALLTLGLLRAWSSSAAALRETLRRRLLRAAGLTASLQAGRYPTRAELSAWSVVDDAVQLGFAGLLVADSAPAHAAQLNDAIERHCVGVRAIIESINRHGPAQDAIRVGQLERVLRQHASVAVVAFTQFADTAVALYRALAGQGGVALVTGRGAVIASGRVATAEVVRLFDEVGPVARRDSARMPVRLLIASDVLSEGVSLRLGGVLVHLDLPWTIARLEQRIGRLRRMGSPHARIAVYAIGPPVQARVLSSVVRALRRKARVSAVLGAEAPPGPAPLLGSRLQRVTRTAVERADTGAIEELRALLTTWLDPRRVDMRLTETRVVTAAVRQAPLTSPWVALALVRQASRFALVRITEHGVTDRAYEVLPIVRLVDRLAHAASDDSGTATAREAAQRAAEPLVALAIERLRSWMGAQRASELVAPATDVPSAAHAGVLRFLDGVVAGTPRARFASVIPLVERCRGLVLAARGVGAEWVLERWLIHTRDSSDLPPVEAVEALTAMLSSRGVSPASRGANEASIVGLVLMLTGGP